MSHSHELAVMGNSRNRAELEAQSKGERDTQVLARLGKKSVLEVRTSSIEACANTADMEQASFWFHFALRIHLYYSGYLGRSSHVNSFPALTRYQRADQLVVSLRTVSTSSPDLDFSVRFDNG